MFIEVALVRQSVWNFLANIASHFGVGILYGVSSIPRRIFLFRFMAVFRASSHLSSRASLMVFLVVHWRRPYSPAVVRPTSADRWLLLKPSSALPLLLSISSIGFGGGTVARV